MQKFFRKITCAIIITAASLLVSANASANFLTDASGLNNAAGDRGFLVINTFALHFKNFNDRNAVTPGIGWEYSPSGAVGWHIGTVSDSFGYQATYGGLNYATRPMFRGKVRLMLAATVLHKQYHVDSDPETKLVPLPAVEFRMSKRAVLNVSGSPQIDYAGIQNNAVLFFQLKIGM